MLDYAIIDFQDRQLKVVYEATTRKDAEAALTRLKDDKCEVYYETIQGGKVFRVICEKITVSSFPEE